MEHTTFHTTHTDPKQEGKKIDKLFFEKIFRYYHPRVSAYAASLLNNRKAAEDIAQDLFLYVWEHREELEDSGQLQAYLYQGTYNRCVDYLRHNMTVREFAERSFQEQMHLFEDLQKEEGQPLQSLFSQDLFTHLNRLLESIPTQRREVFVLAYMRGLKSKEIADRMDMPVRTVESHLYLTLKFLREHLSKNDYAFLFI